MKRVIALGFFDGVHLGHGALLHRARERADELGCLASVMTFDQHPDELVFGQPTPLISTIEDRTWLMTHPYQMDEVLVAHFDRAMMEMPWETFVEELLVKQREAVHVVCGSDFTFGYHGEGNTQRLREKCRAMGIGCDVIEKIAMDGKIISSTRIRQLLQEGKMEQANELLGHPQLLTGTVIPGKQLGRQLGIPTANLELPKGLLVPALGVYATQVVLPDGSRRMAVTNVGVAPTVEGEHSLRVEPWILDFDGDLYGQKIRVEFYARLRPEKKFASLEKLKTEIHRNALQTRRYFETT